MSAEHHKSGREADGAPRHSDVSFEERDIKVGTIYWYLFALGAATAAALVICIFILHFTSNFAASSDTPPPPSREALGKDYPPEPRLQGVPGHQSDAQKDLRQKLKADNAANEKLEWIDKNAGIAQIPVEDAMKIVEEKGLPVFSAPAAEKKK
jgi:7-keto-8-aminopelargonate synthetase-like enzyme